MSKQSAWEALTQWMDEQAAQRGRSGFAGFDAEDVAVGSGPRRRQRRQRRRL